MSKNSLASDTALHAEAMYVHKNAHTGFKVVLSKMGLYAPHMTAAPS